MGKLVKQPASLIGGGQNFSFSKTALSIKRGCSERAWKDLGSKLAIAHESVRWWIGDWLAHGEHRKDNDEET